MIAALALGPAMAQETCATKAIDKNGKPLAGAALNSFLKKCKREACEPKAVSAEGKKLSGAAKNSFMQRARVLPAAQADSNPFTTRGPDPLGSPMAILFPPGDPPVHAAKKPRSSGPYRPASRSTGSPSMHRWPVPPRKKSGSEGGRLAK